MIYKNAKEWTCKYCGATIISRKALREHIHVCEKHNAMPKDKVGRVKDVTAGKRSAATFKKKVQAGLAKYISHKQSEASKKKISAARIKALQEGRGNHWICPTIKRSYAEQYFYDAFVNAKLTFQNNVWLCKRYCVDFLFRQLLF